MNATTPLFISIVVPAYNAASLIRDCLDSLMALDYPKEYLEILLVDNASTDETASIIKTYPVHYLVEKERGSTSARNAALQVAKGEIVAFTDTDCVVDVRWAHEINRTFQNVEADAVMGFADGINENFWATLEQRNFEEFWYRKKVNGYELRRSGIDTRNSAIRRHVLEACGLFNPRFGYCADLDLSTRLSRGGYPIVFNERMRVKHRNRTELYRILSIKAQHGRTLFHIHAQHPDTGNAAPLPGTATSLFGASYASMSQIQLGLSRLALIASRYILVAGLIAVSSLGMRPTGIVVKLFKTLCRVVSERAMLDEKCGRGVV